MAPGAGAILGGLTLASIRRLPRQHYLLFFLAAGFGTSIAFFAMSRHFLLSLMFLFIAGGFQTTFLSAVATLLQIHAVETNRSLGPMGSFPFGLIATATTPFTTPVMTPVMIPFMIHL